MKVLITGGFGFLGGRLAQYLSLSGCQVVLTSRKYYKQQPTWLPESIITQIDWDSRKSIEECLIGVDAVVHAAGMNSNDCYTNPVAAYDFNTLATAKLVEEACKQNIKKFVYFSTYHVYSTPMSGIITEDTCTTNYHPYAASHHAAENIVLWATQQNNLEGVVLRFSNVVGSPAHEDADCWSLIANDLSKQAVEKKVIKLKSSGNQYRDFVAITDVLSVVKYFLTNSQNRHQCPLYNVGGGSSHTVYDIAKLIRNSYQSMFGESLIITRSDNNNGENCVQFTYSINRLKELGINTCNNLKYEIDDLISFCAK